MSDPVPDAELKPEVVEPQDVSMEGKKKRGKKRKAKKNDIESKRRRANEQPKNALMVLNELIPGLVYIFQDQQGPAHEPCFVVSVDVKGTAYLGKGHSKQLAKHAAAEAVLASLGEPPSNPEEPLTSDMDFKSDATENGSSFFYSEEQKIVTAGSTVSQTKMANKLQKVLTEADTQNPVMMLNELRPGLQYMVVKENVNIPNKRFVMCVTIDENVFEASGPSKKAAKAAAARCVLSKLYNVRFRCNSVASTLTNYIDQTLLDFPQVIADKMAKCINDTYTEIITENKEYSKWKVLAGFIMTKDDSMEDMQVVSIGTGTKHLNGEYMSLNGGSINDCHAEIISRRCLKDFFYTQLELHIEGEGDHSIFEAKPNGKFSLLPNIKFHLFISTSPCGDARIFSVHGEEDSDAHPNRKARGLLRTKIESGEGTIPVKMGEGRLMWDGIVDGQQRYLNMSCSDKIASWNVLGLQGSLLSLFVEPIYLESIVLGRLFHPCHLYRALCGRFMTTLEDLPGPYGLHKPKMCATTTLDIRQLTKSPNFSVNWTVGLGRPEIVLAKTGKLVSGQISRLSKRSLFQRFSNVFSTFSSSSVKPPQSCLYSNMKKSNADYVKVKEKFLKACMTAGLGNWVKKPAEEEEFELVF